MQRIVSLTRSVREARPFAPSSRSGLALLVVLIALGIASTIGLGLARLSLLYRRQAEREVFAAQSRWLAESGADRAAALLAIAADSQGASWKIPAKELDGRHAAQVTIIIKPVENAPKRREVNVTADYPFESPLRVTAQLQRIVDL